MPCTICKGRSTADLPPRLYDAYIDFRWLSQVTPKLGLDLAITPGVFSDFDQDSSKAFRLPGHAAAAWTWNETTKIVLGAAYLDRPDVEVIPIGGVIWTPNEDVKFDLVFPHPKISRRIYWSRPARRRRAGLGLHRGRVRRRRLGHRRVRRHATTRSC